MKKNKTLNDELDMLLSKTSLPSDYEIKQETTSKKLSLAGQKSGNKAKQKGQIYKISSVGGKVAASNIENRIKLAKVGKKQGKINVDSGFLDKIRTKEGCIDGGYKGFEKQCVELICPKCGTEGKGRVMYLWHFDKCKTKTIYQFDLNNNFIKIWKNTKELTNAGFKNESIINCCNGKKKNYKGFIWKYKK